MLNPDELEPPRKATKPVDLPMMSIEELEDYIAAHENEIAKARAIIAKKESHRSNVDALFGKPKD